MSPSAHSPTQRKPISRARRGNSRASLLEREELTRIYQARGVDRDLAVKVADQMMAHDGLAAHARDELGISEEMRARPLQAALASALSFTAGAAAPLAAVAFAPSGRIVAAVSVVALVCLGILGVLGARAGAAPIGRSVMRVGFWGALAMIVTASIGRLFGATVG